MAMHSGSNPAQINVTPLLDVLLVLLIIFMAISPTRSEGLSTQVPQPANTTPATPPPPDRIIELDAQHQLTLNTKAIPAAELTRTLAQQPNADVFLRAAKDLDFQEIATVIDLVHAAGIHRFGLLTHAAR